MISLRSISRGLESFLERNSWPKAKEKKQRQGIFESKGDELGLNPGLMILALNLDRIIKGEITPAPDLVSSLLDQSRDGNEEALVSYFESVALSPQDQKEDNILRFYREKRLAIRCLENLGAKEVLKKCIREGEGSVISCGLTALRRIGDSKEDLQFFQDLKDRHTWHDWALKTDPIDAEHKIKSAIREIGERLGEKAGNWVI